MGDDSPRVHRLHTLPGFEDIITPERVCTHPLGGSSRRPATAMADTAYERARRDRRSPTTYRSCSAGADCCMTVRCAGLPRLRIGIRTSTPRTACTSHLHT
jgi:hypothetical protein